MLRTQRCCCSWLLLIVTFLEKFLVAAPLVVTPLLLYGAVGHARSCAVGFLHAFLARPLDKAMVTKQINV